VSNKLRKQGLWQDLTRDYVALAKRADEERAARTAADLFVQEIEGCLGDIRTALKSDDPLEMEAAHDAAFDAFGHIIHPELFAGPAEDEDDNRPKKHGAPQVDVKLPADLDPIYSNFAIISHSPSEIVIDFARLLPGVHAARVDTRVVMTVDNAQKLLRALRENLRKHAAKYGDDLAEDDNPFAGEAPDWLTEDDEEEANPFAVMEPDRATDDAQQGAELYDCAICKATRNASDHRPTKR